MADEENKFYFENGMTLHEVFANHTQRNLKLTENLLDVSLVARDFWIKISGEKDKISRAKEFFMELANVCRMRKRHLDQNDFEQVLRAFRNDSSGELKQLFSEKIKVGPKKRDIVPRSRAQNTTPEQMLMFLTRLGFDSQCVITGDPLQTDLPDKQCSGLVHAAKVLKDIPEIGISKFSSKDVVRHMLVEKIINAYHQGKQKSV
ncbi:MAG: PhoH family protein [Victivallaceae bacterium]|nr:PhoH family protein [Victivallaceae bacterium]